MCVFVSARCRVNEREVVIWARRGLSGPGNDIVTDRPGATKQLLLFTDKATSVIMTDEDRHASSISFFPSYYQGIKCANNRNITDM